MAEQSVFEKKYVEKDKMSDVEGLLEHFNLPPNVITFIRKNVRIIQVVIAIIVVAVVAFSLYDSYRDKKIEDASNALTLAMEESSENRIASLKSVVGDYSGTASALWAQVALANQHMEAKDFEKAQIAYDAVLQETKESNPVQALALFGKAQAFEGLGNYEEAKNVYTKMKDIEGYKHIAFFGIARSYEAKGQIDEAIATYNEFTLSIVEGQTQEKKLAEAKITRLKSLK